MTELPRRRSSRTQPRAASAEEPPQPTTVNQSFLSTSLSPVIFAHASSTALRQRRKFGPVQAFENYLALVSSLYYGGSFACRFLESSGKRRKRGRGLSTVPVLLSPLRKDYGFEKWSPYEIAVFETGLCTFGKQFKLIEGLLGWKSYSEITQFYYKWKQTSHYQAWKAAMSL